MQLDPSDVKALIRNDRLLAVKLSDEVRIPLAQLDFISDPERLEVLNGIADVLSLFAIREARADRHFQALVFLTQRDPAIARTPFEALRNRRAGRVISLMKARQELDQLEAEASEVVERLETSGLGGDPSRDYIFAKAVDVFGSGAAALEWLQRPALALNRERPINLLETSDGRSRLRTLLIQLDYSVYI